MTTKLDRTFVEEIKKAQLTSAEGFNALVLEVERLEAIVVEAVRIIKQGKAQFAPHTTNSEADAFLAQHS